MITLKDIIKIVAKYHHLDTINCHSICCDCSKFNWCFNEYDLLTMDYLYRGEYYG